VPLASAEALSPVAAEPDTDVVNGSGRAAIWLAAAAGLLGAAFIGSTYGGGSARWQVAGRIALFAAGAILAVVATIFGALGMWLRPKRPAVTGFVLGIVVFLAVPGFLIGRETSDRYGGAGGYADYSECIRDPLTTYATCASLFPDS
jgi:uncharacterized membrane protein YdcZ (DUF606 family)